MFTPLHWRSSHNHSRRDRGFTLIELLVVVSIIALLISILLPSLKKAREQAKAVVCGSNVKNVANAVASHQVDSQGLYPVSYAYPVDSSGTWDPKNQSDPSHPWGYVHWSYALYSDGKVGDGAFECPSFLRGGTPRTNPGPDRQNWEPGQVDQNGNTNPNDLEDKQAPRMAFSANATIMPRNKFTAVLSGGVRTNMLVNDSNVKRAGNTILLAEFLNNWKAMGVTQGGGRLSKSHRPINPFYHVGSGYNEYAAPVASPGFIYGTPSDPQNLGVLPLKNVLNANDILDAGSGISQINAVGRHHPGGRSDNRFGGTANFLMVDGHVERMTALESAQRRMWGDTYHGINGENKVLNMSPTGS